jgi:hypothetical protein
MRRSWSKCAGRHAKRAVAKEDHQVFGENGGENKEKNRGFAQGGAENKDARQVFSEMAPRRSKLTRSLAKRRRDEGKAPGFCARGR